MNIPLSFFKTTPKHFPSSRSGFTMIEILVVSTIMIVLTAIGLVSYSQVSQNARNGKRKADLETIRQGLVLYRTDEGEYPATTSLTTALSTITGYLNATNIADPKAPEYNYTYSSNGAIFTVCAQLEPSETDYCLDNP